MPEDARGHTILAVDYAVVDRVEDAQREVDLAMATTGEGLEADRELTRRVVETVVEALGERNR